MFSLRRVFSKPNHPFPYAPDQINKTITLTIDYLILDGGFSSDPDGSIVSSDWSMISGPSLATFSSQDSLITSVDNLHEGSYIFQLVVFDNAKLIFLSTS